MLGGTAENKHPLILCHNGSNYEGLQPTSEKDLMRCIWLTKGICPDISVPSTQDLPVPPTHGKMGQPKLVRDEEHYPGTRNICFVNATVQLLSVSGIATFLSTELPDLLSTASPQDFPVARSLASIYSDQAGEIQSAASLRR